jgi:hypothetical protein
MSKIDPAATNRRKGALYEHVPPVVKQYLVVAVDSVRSQASSIAASGARRRRSERRVAARKGSSG